MADYWKSNERKYCDFCKCWIAENKISVSLHEGGKRHKENVAKRITEINKKSTKDQKIQIKIEEEMNKMEKNAMVAYLKDIENNADLTSQIINEKLAETNSTLYVKDAPLPEKPACSFSSSSSKKKNKWQQGKTEDGDIYYWNLETHETVKEAPAEGFVSIADLNVTTKKQKHNQSSFPGKPGKEPKKQKKPKEYTPYIREAGHAVPNVWERCEPMGPQPRAADPYGIWKTIHVEAPADLQLPEQTYVTPTIAVITEPPEKKFKEKTMTSVNEPEASSVAFKKRKINNMAKRNTRQRLDDD